jgi:hypothetical protein
LGFLCECTGECGRSHTKTEGRCGTAHSTAHQLAAVGPDPLATLSQAVTAADLVALCAPCETAVRRAARAARDDAAAAQPDLFDTTGLDTTSEAA